MPKNNNIGIFVWKVSDVGGTSHRHRHTSASFWPKARTSCKMERRKITRKHIHIHNMKFRAQRKKERKQQPSTWCDERSKSHDEKRNFYRLPLSYSPFFFFSFFFFFFFLRSSFIPKVFFRWKWVVWVCAGVWLELFCEISKEGIVSKRYTYMIE